MPDTIREVMTPSPHTLDAGASVQEAARVMSDNDIVGMHTDVLGDLDAPVAIVHVSNDSDDLVSKPNSSRLRVKV